MWLDFLNGEVWFSPDGEGGAGGGSADAGSGQQGGDPQDQGDGGTPETWEAYVEALPEAAKTLYTQHTQGLRSALDAERQQRRDLARQMQEASQKLEEGSEARKALEQANTRLEEANRRIAFHEDAPADLSDPALAYLAAQALDAWDRRGNVDWKLLRERHPQLFRKPAPPAGNAGAGGNGSPGKGFDMNDALRVAAGRNRV